MAMNRRGFIGCAGAGAFASAVPVLSAATVPVSAVTAEENRILDLWEKETSIVTPDIYRAYLADGDTRGLKTLENLEAAFEKVLREAKETVVTGDRPAVWSVYNMGYVIKTRKSLFSIDLVHRRAMELAPLLDFALVTHNHSDHLHSKLYEAMDRDGKTVISNFLDNYGARRAKGTGGYIRGVKKFKLKDVEIRTSLIDHNDYLLDFTTAFEIRTGKYSIYHTGDSGKGTEPKLETVWGNPDLWLFFPGCGIDAGKAAAKVRAKRVVFGHLWELAHKKNGRLDAALIRRALANVRSASSSAVSFALWGGRI